MTAKCKEYDQIQRLYQQKRVSRFTLKTARNSYYYTVRVAKWKCCEDFLQGAEEVQETIAGGATAEAKREPREQKLRDTERCWTVL